MHGSTGSNTQKSNIPTENGDLASSDDDVTERPAKLRKLDSADEESMEEDFIDDGDVFLDDEKGELAEDDEDDDFYPSTRAAAAARTGTPSSGSGNGFSSTSLQDSRDRDDASVIETRKRRHRTTPEQLRILESAYRHERMPSLELREKLALQLTMTARRVQIWFQNKRAKDKRARVTVRLQSHKSSARQTASRDAQASPSLEYSSSPSPPAPNVTPPRSAVGASYVVPMRTPDGKVVFAAIAAPVVSQAASPGPVYSTAAPAVGYPSPMVVSGIPMAQPLAPPASAPGMVLMNQMSANQFSPMPMYGWPGLNPAVRL